ncbi:ribose transport system ATP-binding protein [Thermanaeromonas toyohensis ToBE]|uniref:Ribose transport system ATP-binding protein n=1 Tax=Thermanaeromonas toyohensis ToBE TaxID=698762 RepID=A0A1W1VCE8_9FIRM|nr:sugar ABC transporter ATP-binding protein [Thermanaeromonas toyohensis]SMB90893.1 ribose transport system ATP-binding protein [Thermanaeromonas toyohensis ToBE]
MSVLQARNITKIYPGTVALDNVSISFESGKVHALVGKNGSGKSTLVKIFSGAVEPTRGEILIDGTPIKFSDPAEAFLKGIATVYQELSLVPGLTVAENIFMGRLPTKGRFVDWKKTYAMAKELLEEMKVDIPPQEIVYNLSMWQRQMVEIVKAMSFKPKVLLLDEPTSALSYNETQSLFKMVKELKKKDVIIIYVSHRLQELWEIADTCTVLRDGKLIGTISMESATHEQIIKMMFGDVKIYTRPSDLQISDEIVLEVKDLTRKNYFENISFKLKKGEILGIAGMLGSGRTELLKSIFGADPIDNGEIILNGKHISKPDPIKMKKEGLVLSPEDRKNEGLNLMGSIRDNLCLASLDLIASGPFIKPELENNFANRQVKDLEIKVADITHPVSSLSGGNQQKVVVGKWLNTDPQIILFDEPSRGIDVNAKQQIFKIIWDLSRKGVSSIIVSSELEELLEICHRILIMRQGHIIGEVKPEETNIEQLYSLCMGVGRIEARNTNSK